MDQVVLKLLATRELLKEKHQSDHHVGGHDGLCDRNFGDAISGISEVNDLRVLPVLRYVIHFYQQRLAFMAGFTAINDHKCARQNQALGLPTPVFVLCHAVPC